MIYITIIFVVLTIVLLTGRGSFLVAGYNTLSEKEKEGFDKKKVSRQAGWLLLIIDIPIITLNILDYLNKMKDIYAIITLIYIILAVVIYMLISSKKVKKNK